MQQIQVCGTVTLQERVTTVSLQSALFVCMLSIWYHDLASFLLCRLFRFLFTALEKTCSASLTSHLPRQPRKLFDNVRLLNDFEPTRICPLINFRHGKDLTRTGLKGFLPPFFPDTMHPDYLYIHGFQPSFVASCHLLCPEQSVLTILRRLLPSILETSWTTSWTNLVLGSHLRDRQAMYGGLWLVSQKMKERDHQLCLASMQSHATRRGPRMII